VSARPDLDINAGKKIGAASPASEVHSTRAGTGAEAPEAADFWTPAQRQAAGPFDRRGVSSDH